MTITNLLCRVIVTFSTNVYEFPTFTVQNPGSVQSYAAVTGKRVETAVTRNVEWEGGGMRFTNAETILRTTNYFRSIQRFELMNQPPLPQTPH